MEAQQTEPLTWPSQNYAASFFATLPRDSRFLNCNFQKIVPTSNLDGRTLTFTCQRFEAPNCYNFSECCIEATVVIVKSDGSLPGIKSTVSTCNNLLHSIFKNVRIKLNDYEITKHSTLYPYKSYIATCLTYSSYVKSCQLQSQGYYSDLSDHFGADSINTGFTQRSCLFRKNFQPDNEFKPGGTTLIGRLHHDLITTSVPLPPGTKIVIELDRSEDEFVILTPKTDPEKYKLKLLNVCLYMPIAQLSQSVYQEFAALWTKPKDLQSGAVNIHYRRSEIRTVSIASNAQEFNSDVLFADEGPCRLVFVLVNTAAKNGQYDLNPFEFRRKWEYKLKKANLNVPQENLTEKELWEKRISDIEKESQKRISQIQERFELLTIEKGKGRGKKSTSAAPTTPGAGRGSISQSLPDRVRQCNISSEAGSSSSFERLTSLGSVTSARELRAFQERTTLVDDDPDPPPNPDPPPEPVGTVYVRKIELLLNGTPVDQVEDREDEDECIQMFWRMNQFCGFNNTPFSNGLRYC